MRLGPSAARSRGKRLQSILFAGGGSVLAAEIGTEEVRSEDAVLRCCGRVFAGPLAGTRGAGWTLHSQPRPQPQPLRRVFDGTRD